MVRRDGHPFPDLGLRRRRTSPLAGIAGDPDETAFGALRAAGRIGRPLGNRDFIDGLERVLGRAVARRAPGRKKATAALDQPPLL